MSNENGQKKKGDRIDPNYINLPPNLNTSGRTSGHDSLLTTSGYLSNPNITGKLIDYGTTSLNPDFYSGKTFSNSTANLAAEITGIRPNTLAIQTDITGTSGILAERLTKMEINTIADARNFFVGVNNVASVLSKNTAFLHSFETASSLATKHNGFIKETMNSIKPLATSAAVMIAKHPPIDHRLLVNLSESMTTLVAYGQAVQNQFGIITDKDRLNIGTTIHNNSDLVVGKVPHISLYDGSKAITSPFIYTPKAIDTSELLLQIPAIKDDLIEAKKEAVRFFEKLESAEKDAKTKDQKIENQEKVIKSLRDQIDLIKKDINVIREAKFIGSLTEDFQVGQLSCKNSMVYYGRDYIHFPTQEKWVCLLLMQASKEKDSVVSENTLSESISTKNGLSHKNLQKLVSNVRRTLKRKNAKIQIKYLNGESFMMILNDIR